MAALKKLPTYVAEQAASNAPSMAAPLAAGEAGAMIGGPLVGLASGIGTYGLQQYGQFMQRQAQGAKDVSQLEPGKAAVAAASTAPLGYFVDRLTAGMSSVPANVLGENILSELAKRAGRSVAGRAATGATLGIVAESPTEVLEQMAERWQAGLPLFDEQAKQEYKEAAAGAAALGGIAGGVGHVLGGQHQEIAPEAYTKVNQPAPELETPAQAPETQQQPPQLGYTPGEPELTPIYPIPRERGREYVGPYGLLPEEAGAPRLPAPDQQATTQQALPTPEAPAPAAEPVTPSPRGHAKRRRHARIHRCARCKRCHDCAGQGSPRSRRKSAQG